MINNCVAAAAPTSPLLRRRADAELEQIETVRTRLSDRCTVIPLLPTEPVGVPALAALTAPTAAVPLP